MKKNTIYKVFFGLLFFSLFNESISLEKYDNLKDALNNYPRVDKRAGKEPKFVYFTMKPHVKDLDYYSKLLYQFMFTMGVRPHFVTLQNNELLGIVPRDSEIDVDAIMDTFGDVLKSIDIKDKYK
jgi:hypothetical protein